MKEQTTLIKEIKLKAVLKEGEIVLFQGNYCTVKNIKANHIVLHNPASIFLITIHKSNYEVVELLEPYEDDKMKEHVVDELIILEELRTKDATSNTVWRQYSKENNVVVSLQEYEQLKSEIKVLRRLDENVKKKHAELQQELTAVDEDTIRWSQLNEAVELLEGLYHEKP